MIYLLIAFGIGLFWFAVLAPASTGWAAVVGVAAFVMSFLAMCICASGRDELDSDG